MVERLQNMQVTWRDFTLKGSACEPTLWETVTSPKVMGCRTPVLIFLPLFNPGLEDRYYLPSLEQRTHIFEEHPFFHRFFLKHYGRTGLQTEVCFGESSF